MRRICLILLAVFCIYLIITQIAYAKDIAKSTEQEVTLVTEKEGKEQPSLGTAEKIVIIVFVIINSSFVISFIIITIYRINHYSKLYHMYNK